MSSLKPIVKWSGGKKDEIKKFIEHIPENFNTYLEPFIGGGAVLFNLQPKKAVINDFNNELINVYKTIKEHPEKLIADLKTDKNESDYFYNLRT